MTNRARWHFVLLAILIMSSLPALAAPATAAPAAAPLLQANTLTLNVVSATDGATIGAYKYIINVDNTGTTEQRSPDPGTGCSPADAGYPASCNWVSIAGVPGSSPIYTQGDQADFATGMTLPPGRYLISVMSDGYKLDGKHFTIPMNDPGVVTVELQPFPLPEATIRAWVFEDISPTNSAPDAPAEHGLAGFAGHIADYIDLVTTDIYGNPLCTRYEGEDPVTFQIPASALDADGLPVVQTLGHGCFSDADGMLAIPHVGPNRYALSAVPPDGSGWIQTTTLEGNHDWDAWVMEGSTGYDTEFVVAGEPFPAIFFGFVQSKANLAGGSGHIKGVVDAFKTYVPGAGGVVGYDPVAGSRPDHPIDGPWLSLVDLENGDTAVWIGQGNAQGAFDIGGVPDGNYSLAWWDEPQDYILNLQNVTVANGETVDLGVIPLAGWWTTLEGYVFNDLNRNGIKDAGEPGMANFPVSMKKRENSMMDRGAVQVTTDANGYYFMENAYPMTQWLVMEGYSDLYYTTGVTYQADNQPAPTTVLGAGVDVSVLPIIGLGGRLDWGVHAYAPSGGTPGVDPDNGGIVGTVSYDTTRNELDPRYAAVENWQPGISNVTVNLYAPVTCDPAQGACDASGRYKLASDGSFAKGQKLNAYVTETWHRPGAEGDGVCIPRDVNNNPLAYLADQQVTDADTDCLEAPLMGVQFGPYATDQGTPDANFGAAVDGNYGFGDGCFGTGGASGPEACQDGSAPTPLTPGDYLVQVETPKEPAGGAHEGRPLYQVTREEDINIFNGDQFVPQIPPPECAGPLHTVDVAGAGTDGYEAIDYGNGVVVPASTPVQNQPFADAGGTVYEGQQKPLCDTKLVRVSNGRSIAPTFNFFTDVPVPGRLWGLIVDDLNFSSDPKSILYGEKAGVPFAPVGVYDYNNRLITTVESDYNGLWDVLMPSTNRINCPTPSGVCANVFRFVGNDPGIPGRLNGNFNPQFRTIAAEFEVLPGLIVPADLAPTQMAATIQLPGGQFNTAAVCTLDPAQPQLFAVSQPYVNAGGGSFMIDGQGFGGTPGQVTLDGTIVLPASNWSDTHIDVSVPAATPAGPHQLSIKAANGLSTVNGLTFHVLGQVWPAFPGTAVLDNFNRNGFGGNWNVTTNAFALNQNSVRAIGTGIMRWGGNAGGGPSYGANQEAYFTFLEVSPTSTEQGLYLKISGSGQNPNPTDTSAAYVEVSYKATSPTAVEVRTKANGTNTVVLQAAFPATVANGDRLGARALADGTVIAYKTGVEIGRVNLTSTATPWPAANVAGGGRLGIRFVGAQNNTTNDARFDDFGGGTITSVTYPANLYEVGPGRPYATVQSAIDAATNSAGTDLVVVYPGTPDASNPRLNPRGAYYENLIISSPLKLQGVGPGGVIVATNATTPGSIIDGSAFAGDTALADAWRARIAGMTWAGNQPPEMSEGEVILLLAQSQNQYGATFKGAIDGFDIRGGDQQGTANNVTQGGAIYAHAYVRNLQITNNVIESNNSSFGTVRIGTPNLPAPDTSQHNEDVSIANNRIIANSGTNLAGGIGLFAGADRYEVAFNDICGNFSAEYGGGLSVYGFSPNGKVHDNRIYFNQSYDEGGGVIIAGQLPADPATLSPGSGAADIYNNQIQANMANDDGGGLRFLMAGNFPMNVYNNMIVNNVSTHEAGGIGLNDAPAVRVYNNTIMKNLTTATAVTSNGQPAPSGLSTSANSDLLQATLPAGSPSFSDPLLFNNIFWDNRAGTRGAAGITGLGLGGAGDIYNWDLGVADGTGSVSPSHSIQQVDTGTTPGAGILGANPAVVGTYDVSVAFAPWRTNPNFIGAYMVAIANPPNLMGNYHLAAGSPAIDAGAASKAVGAVTVNAPAFDFDRQARPTDTGFDIGADEVLP